MRVPHLADFEAYRIVDDVDLHGVVVPGLRAEYLRLGRQVASSFSYLGRQLFAAWGFADEEHCRYFTVVGLDGLWEDPQPGCPRARALHAAGRLLGVGVRSRTGVWLVSEALDPAEDGAADGRCLVSSVAYAFTGG